MSAPDPVQAADLLHRLAAEVERAQHALLDIEQSILPLIVLPGADSTGHLMQGVDLVVQSLGEIARVLAGVSHQVPPGVLVDAAAVLNGLRLHDLGLRLTGGQAAMLHSDERIALF